MMGCIESELVYSSGLAIHGGPIVTRPTCLFHLYNIGWLHHFLIGAEVTVIPGSDWTYRCDWYGWNCYRVVLLASRESRVSISIRIPSAVAQEVRGSGKEVCWQHQLVWCHVCWRERETTSGRLAATFDLSSHGWKIRKKRMSQESKERIPSRRKRIICHQSWFSRFFFSYDPVVKRFFPFLFFSLQANSFDVTCALMMTSSMRHDILRREFASAWPIQ